MGSSLLVNLLKKIYRVNKYNLEALVKRNSIYK